MWPVVRLACVAFAGYCGFKWLRKKNEVLERAEAHLNAVENNNGEVEASK